MECRRSWIFRLALFAFFVFALQLEIPVLSYAETVGLSAGFAPRAIWISRAHATAGESVNIFTVLYNSSDDSISGDVIFLIDDASIGAKNFTLKSGETQILSAPWTAKVGDHSISARIEKLLVAGRGASASALYETTGNVTVSVAAPPPPSPAALVLGNITAAIETGAASSAPAVMSALASLYDKAESLRMDAKSALEEQVVKNADSAAKTGSASEPKAGSASDSIASSGAGASVSQTKDEQSLLAAAGKYAALAGLAVVSSKTLFYVSLALVLLLLIQMLRVFLRERRRAY